MINHDAVYALYPNVTSITERSALGTIEIKDADGNDVAIDRAAVDAWVSPTKYQRDRAKEYPSIGDQLDALFHAGVFPAEMAATIQAVKDKYPKEGS
jgi:hypothetical protein